MVKVNVECPYCGAGLKVKSTVKVYSVKIDDLYAIRKAEFKNIELIKKRPLGRPRKGT